MKYQRFVSLTAMLSFILLFISSGVLYFIPDRGVMDWSSWTFLGLSKQQWDNIHINIGILFLVMIIWHIYFNWKPIKNYLKVKKELKIFTKEFNIALVVTVLFTAGTITMTNPFSFLVNIGNGIKAMNSKQIGNPPFAYAEYSSLEDFCILTSIDLIQAQKLLKENNIKITSSKNTLKQIAQINDTTPKNLFAIIKTKFTRFHLPSQIPVGIAHKTIQELSNSYFINTNKFLTHLKKYNINTTKDTKFKKIAMQNNLHPAQLYNMLLASQK
jgi:hypothetical protein